MRNCLVRSKRTPKNIGIADTRSSSTHRTETEHPGRVTPSQSWDADLVGESTAVAHSVAESSLWCHANWKSTLWTCWKSTLYGAGETVHGGRVLSGVLHNKTSWKMILGELLATGCCCQPALQEVGAGEAHCTVGACRAGMPKQTQNSVVCLQSPLLAKLLWQQAKKNI